MTAFRTCLCHIDRRSPVVILNEFFNDACQVSDVLTYGESERSWVVSSEDNTSDDVAVHRGVTRPTRTERRDRRSLGSRSLHELTAHRQEEMSQQ